MIKPALTEYWSVVSVAAVPEANWLPTAPGKPFSLTWRTYIPKEIVKQGKWFPPAVAKRD